ncbi:Hsp20/alpha crystallin family protein [Daejeonella lutea]|uniref:HSP20 family protein n=1 Tax=Daejeonella lutea TaxID=572036 RepID=A0A1T5CW74_9SPHI|nr:Hsp20/alpha crystallin family protein [Daejeonella lutea]SKB63674.1 HSP20 family protein [Daejeonella lutea]
MTLVKFNNQKGTNSLLPGYNEVFDSIFNDTFFTNRTSFVPAVNISESADAFHIEMAAPGLRKEHFKLHVENNMLTVSAEVSAENSQNEKRYAKREFNYTSFVRSFNLPDTADDSRIEALYENGVLRIDIGKREEAKTVSRQIEIR